MFSAGLKQPRGKFLLTHTHTRPQIIETHTHILNMRVQARSTVPVALFPIREKINFNDLGPTVERTRL